MPNDEKKFSNIEQIINMYLPDYQEIKKEDIVQLDEAFGNQLASDLLESFRKDLKEIRKQNK